MRKLRKKIFVLFDYNSFAAKIFTVVIAVLILTAVVLSAVLVGADLSATAKRAVTVTLYAIISVFAVEYLLRLFTGSLNYPSMRTGRGTLRFLLSFASIIDLLSIIPFFFGRWVHINTVPLLLLRLFTFIRYFRKPKPDGFSEIGDVLKSKAKEIFAAVGIVLLLIVVAGVMMYSVENPAQPEAFSSIFDGMWYSVVSITTIGYGDIVPVTVIGKILGAVISLLGIMLIAVPTGIISSGFAEYSADKHVRSQSGVATAITAASDAESNADSDGAGGSSSDVLGVLGLTADEADTVRLFAEFLKQRREGDAAAKTE